MSLPPLTAAIPPPRAVADADNTVKALEDAVAAVALADKPGDHTSTVEQRVSARLKALAAASAAGAAAEEDGEDDTHGGWEVVHDSSKRRKGGPKPQRR